MAEVDLFLWWAASISGGILFLTLVSIYLYASSRAKRSEGGSSVSKLSSAVMDFIFVWVLLGLLVFYIISINIGSAAIFAAGNIIVELLLLAYLAKSGKEKTAT